MPKPIPASLKPSREGDVILITVPYYWGKGKTLAEAKKALKQVGGKITGSWRVYSADPEAGLNNYGEIIHKTGHDLIVLAEHNPG